MTASPTVTLVTGPVRSGKSRHAEELLAGYEVVRYVATGRRADPADPEWSARVHQHAIRRPGGWITIETSDLRGVLGDAGSPVLIDCLGTWLTAVVDELGWDDLIAARAVLERRTSELCTSLAGAVWPVVVVTNEVGWSLVPTTASGRFFADELGRLNAAVSRIADAVHLVVAGRVIDLSSAPTVGATATAHPEDPTRA